MKTVNKKLRLAAATGSCMNLDFMPDLVVGYEQ